MRDLKIERSITNRDADSLNRYFTDISKIDLVNVPEEVLLAAKIKEGDQAALERLVKANLRFVVSVAKKYQNQGLTLGDLVNEGNLGLIKAAQRFDHTKGFKFISFAVWWIRQAMLQAIADQKRIIRLPLNQVNGIMLVNKAITTLEQQFERLPTPEELSDYTELTVDKVIDYLEHAGLSLSLDSSPSEESEITLMDTYANKNSPAADEVVEGRSLSQELARMLGRLQARQAEIIRLYYGLDGRESMGMDDIAKMMKISRERVRQIKDATIRTLREMLNRKLMMEYR
ncbi:sigma-70 family RNA polymerase sigma factor [Pedobacter nutrimenti]|jgi:RNA polymerase primary sigma factor|uniref:RNA polymerase primary sigma factor n=1 Tax=Pedobacter nutrimenti TaxID=1241337 RepID=A0A318UGK1_9SPHI|nr:RNA polymerase sigma factor RpoD/SigA [Pedobacter nutrimenti]PYF75584.1 RNA polymerase primary sigma factor [Pedobacter nutrimenti]